MTSETKTKPAWSRPENWATWIGVGAAGLLGFSMLDRILPMVVRVLENTLYAAALGVVLTGLAFLVVNKDIHRLVWVLYKSGMRWLTNLFITIDPIGILKETLGEVRDKIREIAKSEASLREQIRSLEDVIASGDKEMEVNWRRMSAAKKAAKDGNRSMGKTAVLAGRQAGRLKQSNVTLNQLLAKLRKFLDVTVRMREGAEFAAEDMAATIDVEERKRKAVRAAHKALSLANQIIKGDREMEMYNMTLEHLNNDYFEKLGQIEQFMTDSQNALDTMDLQNMVFAEDAFADLEAWEHKADAVGGHRVRVDDGLDEDSEQYREGAEEAAPAKRQSYADLFDIKK